MKHKLPNYAKIKYGMVIVTDVEDVVIGHIWKKNDRWFAYYDNDGEIGDIMVNSGKLGFKTRIEAALFIIKKIA